MFDDQLVLEAEDVDLRQALEPRKPVADVPASYRVPDHHGVVVVPDQVQLDCALGKKLSSNQRPTNGCGTACIRAAACPVTHTGA
jgi:hypothetical protein